MVSSPRTADVSNPMYERTPKIRPNPIPWNPPFSVWDGPRAERSWPAVPPLKETIRSRVNPPTPAIVIGTKQKNPKKYSQPVRKPAFCPSALLA